MINDLFKYEPYELDATTKRELLLEELKALTEIHRTGCEQYSNYLDAIKYEPLRVKTIEDIPFFPVRLFKERDLYSVPQSEIIKITTSSGTTGQMVSKIYLDRETALLQQKVSAKQLKNFWGGRRQPFLIIDSPEMVKNNKKYPARAAAILGMRFFATEMEFALDSNMNLNIGVIESFLRRYGDKQFVVFGFTFMIWQHLQKPLKRLGKTIDMSNAILMTGGGWKKFETEGVSREQFKCELYKTCGISRFLDHYGMAEQVGSIYCECEHGNLHASIFSDVIVRNPKDMSACRIGEEGIIQVVSAVPHSYPGHSVLTEDVGVILGEDDCPCGRKGKYIKIRGRIKNAEIRGCSDTYASRF